MHLAYVVQVRRYRIGSGMKDLQMPARSSQDAPKKGRVALEIQAFWSYAIAIQ